LKQLKREVGCRSCITFHEGKTQQKKKEKEEEATCAASLNPRPAQIFVYEEGGKVPEEKA